MSAHLEMLLTVGAL